MCCDKEQDKLVDHCSQPSPGIENMMMMMIQNLVVDSQNTGSTDGMARYGRHTGHVRGLVSQYRTDTSSCRMLMNMLWREGGI